MLPSQRGAGVAQLVEQRFRKPQVARSIRVAGSNIIKELDGFSVLESFEILPFSATPGSIFPLLRRRCGPRAPWPP